MTTLQRHEEYLLQGWLQGVSWATLGDLYLDGASAEVACATVTALRQRLLEKAQRLERSDLVAELKRERRLHQYWEPAMRQALDRVMRLPDPQPTPASSIAVWLPASIAGRLQAHGLSQLGEVTAFIESQGFQFWHAIPGFGPKSARILLDFFQEHAVSLGPLSLKTSSIPGSIKRMPSPAKRLDVVPLEHLLIPHALDGSQGENRATGRCRINAAQDFEAVTSWLSRWPAESHTYRTYRKEVERFLLWSLMERGKAFSSLNTDDCLAYRRFLAHPLPSERWVGPLRPRFDPEWRPFQGDLSERSRKQAEGILAALCGWLVGQRYLESNPFEGLPKSRFSARLRTDRSLSEVQWRWLIDFAEQRRQVSKGREQKRYARLLLLLRFAYGTGLRLQEIAMATLDHLEFRADSRQWWLQVQGKGSKIREVPIPMTLWQALQTSWCDRGLPANPAVAPSATPVLTSLRRVPTLASMEEEPAYRECALTPSGIHQTLKAFLREAGETLACQNQAEGQRLQHASAHWLRHTHGSHAVRRGVPIEIVRDNLGHSSLATTSIYIHTDRDHRYREMAKLSEDRNTLE
jgi:integrase